MNKDDAKAIMKTKEFDIFINKTSKIVERALTGSVDILGAGFFFEDGQASHNVEEATKQAEQMVSYRERLVPMFTFQQDEQENKRTVTSIEWSPKVSKNLRETVQVSDLLMCTYSKCREWKVDEADGLINLYSMNLRKRPEASLICQYEVTKAIFNPFQPNIVLGATTTGYILQWDVRAKQLPVAKSCLQQGGGHNSPIYGLSITGTQNAHNIVSVSNDGRVCQWSFGRLNEPILGLNLKVAVPAAGDQTQYE